MPNRSKNQQPTDASDAAQAEADAIRIGKGRATPSRREREAARRRPLVPADRKVAREADRERMRVERQRQQAGLAAGDDRYLPARDKGVQRRYARDYVDARWSVGEFLVPVVVILLLSTFLPFPSPMKESISSYVLFVVWGFFIITVIDCFVMGSLLTRRLREKYGEAERGLRWYASMRTIQMRFMRMPKPQAKRGQYPA
ncbi:DUF3043 domain-containing protein [Gryllotalpicola reticulitermitis]|uniref:DUF3043 domain-containing protein n=1 Tax=Gryllotalpicola reticulitermitis TaxID=1184153 RepID=A0ABV8QB87_9MICO